MPRILAIAIIGLVFFLLELIISTFLAGWLKPNLLLLLVIFFNLAMGIRYSLVAAMVAGIISDCFSTNVFGFYLFLFIFCAYMTTFIKRYLYEVGSSSSRIMLVFLVCIVNVVTHYILNSIFFQISFWQAVWHVMLPEVVITTLAAGFIFGVLRDWIRNLAL